MQPSRMFNQSVSRHAELMREVDAMRQAERAAGTPKPRTWRVLSADSLSFRIANWRRLSARRPFGERRPDLATTEARPQGA